MDYETKKQFAALNRKYGVWARVVMREGAPYYLIHDANDAHGRGRSWGSDDASQVLAWYRKRAGAPATVTKIDRRRMEDKHRSRDVYYDSILSELASNRGLRVVGEA